MSFDLPPPPEPPRPRRAGSSAGSRIAAVVGVVFLVTVLDIAGTSLGGGGGGGRGFSPDASLPGLLAQLPTPAADTYAVTAFGCETELSAGDPWTVTEDGCQYRGWVGKACSTDASDLEEPLLGKDSAAVKTIHGKPAATLSGLQADPAGDDRYAPFTVHCAGGHTVTVSAKQQQDAAVPDGASEYAASPTP